MKGAEVARPEVAVAFGLPVPANAPKCRNHSTWHKECETFASVPNETWAAGCAGTLQAKKWRVMTDMDAGNALGTSAGTAAGLKAHLSSQISGTVLMFVNR